MDNFLNGVQCYANDNSAYKPELWAEAGLEILEAKMVMGQLVNRQFEDKIANFGDTVNTRRPSEFKVRRRTDADSVLQQDVSATNVPVVLDQWFYNSFIIKDGEASLAFQDLLDIHMEGAVKGIAKDVDRAVAGQIHRFLGGTRDRVGRLGQLEAFGAKAAIVEAGEVLNTKLVPDDPRYVVLHPNSQSAFLKTSEFTKVNERGNALAIERARMGHLFGFDFFLGQNVPGVFTDLDSIAGTITSATAAGSTASMPCTVTNYEAIVGEFANVAGNDQPTFITARTASTNTTAVTLNEALKYGISSSAVLTVYKACAINGSYAAGYSKGIVLDGFTTGKAPKVGQLLAFDTSTDRRTYTIIEAELNLAGDEVTVHLDRPLAVGIGNDESAFPGPAGAINWAFHPNALALVTRPLAPAPQMAGVLSATASYNGVGMRVGMQYSLTAGGTLVNIDMLAGVATLYSEFCVPLLG